ncbi:MAG TPA: GAF domain-containing protein [Marmoricola sp.]|nr:GAF domain-containing protein [Marmoricola sp.]
MAGQPQRDDRVRRVLEMVPELLRRDRPRADVFRDVVDLARSLFDAPYAVGALIREDGSVLQRAISGLPEQAVRSMGPFPSGVGITADVLRSPGPLRLSQLDADEVAVGLPTGHPPVTSFLGVRVTVNRRTVGFLYVVAPEDVVLFTEDDEQLISSLGATLGAALENRALLRDALQARRWLHAASSLADEFFSGDAEASLRVIGDRARDLAEADLVGLAVFEEGRFRIKHLRGIGEAEIRRFEGFPLERSSLVKRVVESRHGAVVSRLPVPEDRELRAMMPSSFGPSMLLPLLGAEAVLGVLFLARHNDSPPFTDTDVEVAGAFANRVAIMLELSAARQVAERVRLVEERNRIARDLHDHVVQRLFATGLSLQQVLPAVPDKERDRVDKAVHTLDETIREIRNTILTLRSVEEETATLETLVAGLAQEATPLLGFPPLVALEAPSGEVSGALAVDLSACIREGLSNIVRHAHAAHVEIHGTIEDDELRVTLSDNGVGIHSNRRSGLDNLAKRMQAHGGRFEVEQPDEGGTMLRWSVPLAP